MADLHDRFRSLDAIVAPDLWPEIEELAEAAETTPQARVRGPVAWRWPSPLSTRFAMAAVLLALLMALIGFAVLVGSQPRVPAPFGSARNGNILYAADDGQIYAFDPARGASRLVVGGAGDDIAPAFSRDGTKFVFARRDGTAERWRVMIADADGSDVRQLTGPLELFWWSWSPDGSRLAVLDRSASTFLLVDTAEGATAPVDLDMKADSIQWRPNGQELVFRRAPPEGEPGLYGLYVVNADGTDLRAIAPPTDSDAHWQAPALSPDGNRIAYTSWSDFGHIFVIDVDTGQISMPSFLGANGSDYFPAWSPDGSTFVFNRGRPQETYHLAVAPASGGSVTDIGPVRAWDVAAAAEFSPDATKIIARYSDGSAWLFDIAGGPSVELPSTEQFLASWQRLAP